MALKQCEDCGGKVSTDAVSCPHCGRRVRPERDKEAIIRGVIHASVIGLTIFTGLVLYRVYNPTLMDVIEIAASSIAQEKESNRRLTENALASGIFARIEMSDSDIIIHYPTNGPPPERVFTFIKAAYKHYNESSVIPRNVVVINARTMETIGTYNEFTGYRSATSD